LSLRVIFVFSADRRRPIGASAAAARPRICSACSRVPETIVNTVDGVTNKAITNPNGCLVIGVASGSFVTPPIAPPEPSTLVRSVSSS
jgi:hypothetical protein